MVGELNRWLRGGKAYFAPGYPKSAYRQLDWFLLNRLAHHLARRSQCPFRRPEGVSLYAHLQTLGLQFLWPTTR